MGLPTTFGTLRLLQQYLSDLLNLFFPPENPEGPEALWPWWKLGLFLGLLSGIGYLAFGWAALGFVAAGQDTQPRPRRMGEGVVASAITAPGSSLPRARTRGS